MSAPLQQYLPRLVRYWDEDAPGQLHRSIDGSLAFVDISGFTRMSERLARHGKVGAEEVTEVIDDTFGTLLPEAYAFGANLLKFGGDALLLLFTGEGHQLRSAAASLAMRRRLREIGVFETTAGRVHLRMSIGIHSGPFDFFLTGGSHRELIVAGPAATRTVEMESAAVAGQILISPETAAALPAGNRGAAAGPGFLLRGSLEADLLDFRAATTPPDRDLAPFIPVALRPVLGAGSVEPEHRPATIAFIHYSGFDRLVTARGAARAGEVLDRFITVVQEAVDNHGITFLGTDIAADGGKVILTGGVPVTGGADEEQMLLALGRIHSDLALRVGVNWGAVFAGEVGPPYRRTYTVMGDAVNLAARLMAKAAPGQVLVTGEVIQASRTLFRTEKLEPFSVKGKREPVQAYEVGEPVGVRDQVAGGLPLIGRDEEVEALLTSWESLAAGSGKLVAIIAEPGMGKSRLLEEVLQRIGMEVRIISSECRLYQSATPYFPFRALLKQALDLDGGPDELRRAVGELSPGSLPWLPLVGAVADVAVDETPEVAQLDQQFRAARTVEVVREVLEASLPGPTVFVIEDTHWIDDASRELLLGLTSSLALRPWLLIVTSRPEDAGWIGHDQQRTVALELKPLSPSAAESLIVAASPGTPLSPQQARTLAARAEGNPLFLIELLQNLRTGGEVDTLPHSVEGLIGARIDRLPPSDRSLLRRLAVLGAGFLTEHAGAVMPEGSQALRAAGFRRLGDFLSVDQRGWVQFRHALIRDVAYGGLPFRTRVSLHAVVGDSISRAAGPQPETQAALLSFHYFQARRWEDAWRFSLLAGDSARSIYANAEAATFYGRALEAARRLDVTDTERAEVLKNLAFVMYEAGDYEAAQRALRQAIRLIPQERIARAELHLRLAQAHQKLGSFSAALRDTALGLRLVTDISEKDAMKVRARLRAFRAGILSDQFRPRAALSVGLRAIEEAKASGELDALARSYTYIDEAYQTLGQRDKAVHEPLALNIFEQLGDLSGIALLAINLGVQAYADGRWDEAIALYSRAQEVSRRSGNEPAQGAAAANLGEVLVSRGRFTEAEAVLEEALRILKAQKVVRFVLFAEIQKGRLALKQGDHRTAVELLSAVVAQAKEAGHTFIAVDAAVPLATALVRVGEPDTALRLIADTRRLAGDDAVLYEAALTRVESEAAFVQGDGDRAALLAHQALTAARQQGLLYDEALVLLLLARIRGNQSQDLEEAHRLLHQLGASI